MTLQGLLMLCSIMFVTIGVSSVACVSEITHQPPPSRLVAPVDYLTPAVHIDGKRFVSEIASTVEERQRGLSGRDYLPPKAGMLFVFESGVASTFWMKDMKMPLDFIWISSECVVSDIMENIPYPVPNTPIIDLQKYVSSVPAAYNFEINAGEVEKFGISVGDTVRFSGVTNNTCP